MTNQESRQSRQRRSNLGLTITAQEMVQAEVTAQNEATNATLALARDKKQEIWLCSKGKACPFCPHSDGKLLLAYGLCPGMRR
jgi:hypothetical protein